MVNRFFAGQCPVSGVNIQAWTLCLFYIFVGQENEFNIYVAKPILKKKIQKLQNVIAPKLQNIKQVVALFLGRYKDAHAEGLFLVT